VSLPAVVGLVAEKMVECRRERLLDLFRPHEGPVVDRACEIAVAQALDIAADLRFLGSSPPAQSREILVEDAIEARW
jgi:hypothetical protein